METIAIVQARMGSTRLPGKVMKTLWGKPIIQIICEKLATCAEVERVIVATTTNSKDDTLVDYLNSQEIDVFRGDEFDVLKRFYDCSQKYQ
jgi:spore coat polysaccharide biosynthesis protein SpsF (cytidylyltransferase family)